MRRLFACLALVLPLVLTIAPAMAADPLPAPISPYVNDFAGIVDEEATANLTTTLTALRHDHGVQMTLVTLAGRAKYGFGSVEDLATTLFNQWGVGDKARNDGIMVLVLPDNREMRLELGSGYSSAYNQVAQEVVDDQFLPAFRRGNYQAGIENGVAAAIARIALPHAEGRAAEPNAKGNALIVGLIAAAVAAGAALLIFWQRISDRFSRCPQCNQRGQTDFQRETLNKATRTTTGLRQINRTCRNCGYHDTTTRVIPMRTSSSSGSFGGGSSSGGGASGRW